jgi:WD40 repeat protein
MASFHHDQHMDPSIAQQDTLPTADEIATALQSLPDVFFHRIASRIMQVGIDGTQLMNLVYSVQSAESSTTQLDELKEKKMVSDEDVKENSSWSKREIDQHLDEDRESLMVAGAMVIHANQSKKQKIDTSTDLFIPSKTTKQETSNLPTPEELASVLQLGTGKYFQQLAFRILEMGIDGKQLRKFVFSVVPHIPVNVVLRQMLPLFDRVSWNRVCSMNKEIHDASQSVTPPWPYKSLRAGSPVWSTAFSPDGGSLACGCSDGVIRIWDRINGRGHQLEGHNTRYIRCLSFSPNGELLASGGDDGTIRLWKLADNSSIILDGHITYVSSVAFAPNGLSLASGSLHGEIRVWNVADGICTKVLRDERMGCVLSVTFSPDGTTLALAGRKEDEAFIGFIFLWDLLEENTGSTLLFQSLEDDMITSLAYSPDGQYLASGGFDSFVRLFDVADRSLHTVFEGHSDRIQSVCFSPNGKILASASNDGSIRLWDVDAEDGSCLVNLSGHHTHHDVTSVEFSSDGRTLASGSLDRTVRLWNPFDDSTRDRNTGWERVFCLWNSES